MDAAQALADLTELSAQIERAAILDGDGTVLASTFADGERARRFAAGARRLAEEADAARAARGLGGLTQLEAATLGGSVFVVRDGERIIAATTRPEPTVGLVFYDLKSCLRNAAGEAEPKAPKARSRAKPAAKEAEPAAKPPRGRTTKKKNGDEGS